MTEQKHDPVNHPKHYAALPAAVECIDIARRDVPHEQGASGGRNGVHRGGRR